MKSDLCSQIFAIWASVVISVTVASPKDVQSAESQSSDNLIVTYNGGGRAIRGFRIWQGSFHQQFDQPEDIRSATINAPPGYGCFFASEASSSSSSSSSTAATTGNDRFISPPFFSGSSQNYPTSPFPTTFYPANPVVFPAARYLSCFRLPAEASPNALLVAVEYSTPADNNVGTIEEDHTATAAARASPGAGQRQSQAQAPYRLIPVPLRPSPTGSGILYGSADLNPTAGGAISRATFVYTFENGRAECRIESDRQYGPEAIFTTEQQLQRTILSVNHLICAYRFD